MPISIYSNTTSTNAQILLGNSQAAVQRNMQHLASGLRVYNAADDAAGLGITTLFNAQVRSYSQAERNSNDGISMLQTAEGALSQIHTALTRMRELAVQSSNGIFGPVDRANITVEVTNLQSEIDRISRSTLFGNVQMLNAPQSVVIQVGINNTADDQITLALAQADSAALKVDGATVKVDTQVNSQNALAPIDAAISAISAQRANIGALVNRVTVAQSNDAAFRMNLSAAMGRIRDVDVAAEAGDLARNQVLTQAGTAMLAQANQFPQVALRLLQN